eukprot:14628691-Heterocapsa_arctica.AAC.1
MPASLPVSDEEPVELRGGGPLPMVLPDWVIAMAADRDTNDHLIKWYLKCDGTMTDRKLDGEMIQNMTTTEVMNLRGFWKDGIAYTILPWARHLNTAK